MQWARDNEFYSKRWLDQHAEFARAWPRFVDAWKWASERGYSPDRRPSLHTAQNLMELKRRDDAFQSANASRRTLVRVKPAAQPIVPLPEKLIINPIQTMLVGDVVEMARKHIADESIDLLVCDPPYNLTIPVEPNHIDQYLLDHNMRPRFREDWDNFPNVEAYAEFTKPWLLEGVRCLHERGSMFIFCSYHSVGPIMWLLQTARINFVHIIPVHQYNQDPVKTKRTLQYSHYFCIWATKNATKYRFHYDAAKWGRWPGDKLNDVHGQLLRDGWNINHNGGQNTTGFPSQKPIAVYNRILEICGLAGGMFGDWFSGSGTGAVAALRWGMKSISIEREQRYVPDIIARVEREMKRKRD